MHREYHRWFSPNLHRDMELLVFGHSGARVLFFPTRMARYYDYENWGVIGAIAEKIEQGWLQIYCVDSVDQESFYSYWRRPRGRIERHLQYEKYIMEEIVPMSLEKNDNPCLMSAGCSFGAYHALNFAFRYSQHFAKVVAMSGRYDLTTPVGVFQDLLEGYYDEDLYFIMPSHYMPNLSEDQQLEAIRKLEIIMAVGEEDVFLGSNQHMSETLAAKDIPHALHIWHGEAHRARYWRKMVQLYL
jgi:esterase/lipase superfamily enzyme